jgi:2-polyprenyl-6-hydroxyphenyl methylase/3-demethylubiquinone-9 3-methyltransferase
VPARSGASPDEIARFDALAARWWDPDGPMRPLHRMNPARIAWVADRIGRHFPDRSAVRVLDVGCGAGLAAEALARLGIPVLGIDAAPAAVAAAVEHAKGQGLPLAYRVAVADDLLREGVQFPVITALEVVEHVPDPDAFLAVLASLLAPGGLLVLSTLNRTAAAFVAAKLVAEYTLRWLPVGTHDWRRFLTPAELGRKLRAAGLRVETTAGLSVDPLRGGWRVGRDLRVNYLMAAVR